MSEIGREENGGRVRVARTNYLHEKEGEKRIGEGQKGVVYQQRVFLAWSLLSGRLRRTADRLEGWPGQTPVHQLPDRALREIKRVLRASVGRFSIAELVSSIPWKTAFFLRRRRSFKDLVARPGTTTTTTTSPHKWRRNNASPSAAVASSIHTDSLH